MATKNGTSVLSSDPFQGETLTLEAPQVTEDTLEKVEGYLPGRTAQDDDETASPSNPKESAFSTEESGSLTGQQEPLKDAYYASFPEEELLSEVVIYPDERVRITATTTYPWRAIVALRMTAQDGSRWIGSGYLVGPRTVITAGHCVFMHEHGGWAKSIEVIAGLNDASRPYGSVIATDFRSVTGWTQSKNRNNDYGAIILPANARLGDTVGYFGFAVRDDNYLKANALNVGGYPGDKGGNQLWWMAQKASSVSARVITYQIDTAGGQSGCPVWVKVGESRYAVGIHTNGHSSGNSATRIVQAVYTNIQNWKALGS